MTISELCDSLERVRYRFGNVEVFSGSAAITGLAVLPRDVVTPGTEIQRGLIVSILSRESDRRPG